MAFLDYGLYCFPVSPQLPPTVEKGTFLPKRDKRVRSKQEVELTLTKHVFFFLKTCMDSILLHVTANMISYKIYMFLNSSAQFSAWSLVDQGPLESIILHQLRYL